MESAPVVTVSVDVWAEWLKAPLPTHVYICAEQQEARRHQTWMLLSEHPHLRLPGV